MPVGVRQHFANNATGSLLEAINNSQTTFKTSISDGAIFPDIVSGEYFYATLDSGTANEVVRVTQKTDVFTAAPAGTENFCSTAVYHVNNSNETNSKILLTVKHKSSLSVEVIIESATNDGIDSVLIELHGGSGVSTSITNGVATSTISYSSSHPSSKQMNILWSKVNMPGMWIVSGTTYNLDNTCQPTSVSYTCDRNIDNTGSSAFSAGDTLELRVTNKTLFDLSRPQVLHRNHYLFNQKHSFGYAAISNRLEGGDLHYTAMSGEYSLTFGTSLGDGTTLPYNKSNGAVVFGKGCINHGHAEGGVTTGIRSMVGVDGAGQEATAAVAMGYFCNAYRLGSVAMGTSSQCFGTASLAVGNGAVASDQWANIALGEGVVTPVVDQGNGNYQTFAGCTAVGRWNKFDDGKQYVFSVGVGEDNDNRFNGFYIRQTTTNWSTGTGAMLGPSGVGFPTLGKSSRYLTDSGAGTYGVLSGELWVDTSGYVRIKS